MAVKLPWDLVSMIQEEETAFGIYRPGIALLFPIAY